MKFIGEKNVSHENAYYKQFYHDFETFGNILPRSLEFT